jgi:uncharacterized protein YndB with AHSA1/START domain
MFIAILIAVAVIIVVFVVIVTTRPDDFRVTRTAIIPAPPEKVFPLVTVLKAWELWSPWAKLDPNAKSIYEGPASGTGAAMRWSGDKKVDEGCMTIIESRPNDLIRIKLEFLKPFKATNTAEFTFNPEGNQTAVTWSMFGKNNFMSKAFGLFVNCDKMVGGDFEKGLETMKSVAKAAGRT